jgi:hypothetical protein
MPTTEKRRARCRNRHNLTRHEVIPCREHGQHIRWVCPMYLGNRRCGDVVTEPPVDRNCSVDDDPDMGE